MSEYSFTKHLDVSTGKFYYYDSLSGQTTWDKPLGDIQFVIPPKADVSQVDKRKVKRQKSKKELIEKQEILDLIRNELIEAKTQRLNEEKKNEEKAERLIWNQCITDAMRDGEMNLSWKSLSGFNKNVFTFEKDFGKSLRALRLIGCGIKEIPLELACTLKNLEILQLSSNAITTVPENFHELTKLRELGLLNNKISKLPSKIGLLCSINKIELSNNCLESIPDSFAAFSRLDRLVIENNKLVVLPENLELMFNCRTLNVSNNQLIRLPRCIGRMPSLTSLNASNNQITYIPTEIVSNKTLRHIRLSKNKISALPGRIGELKKLQEISIDYNLLSGLPMTFYNLTKLKILRVEGNPINVPAEDIIAKGAQVVVDWCRKRYLQDEQYRMRQIISTTQELLENITARNLSDPSRFEPNVMIENDPYYALQLDYLFDELIPSIKKIWHQELISKGSIRGRMNSFPYSKKEVLWAYTNFGDTSGAVMRKQNAYFRRCSCLDEKGRRKPCIPPKTGFMCDRLCTLLKGNLVLKNLKAERIWADYIKKGVEDAVVRAENEAKLYLDSIEGDRWLTKLSFERAEEYLLERGAGKTLKWRDIASERKKKSIVKRYDRLIKRLTSRRDKKIEMWNNQIFDLNEKLKTAREGYMKTVTNAKITDLTVKIADVEENEQIRNLQVECEKECKVVEEDIFDDGSSDSSIGSDLEDHFDKLKESGHIDDDNDLYKKYLKKKNLENNNLSNEENSTKPIKYYDQFNNSYYSQAKSLIMSNLEKLNLKLSDETYDMIVHNIKHQKKLFRKSLDMMEIRLSKFFSLYAGDFNELQKEMKHELAYQYVVYNVNEARRKAEKEFSAIERIRENLGGAGLKKSFNEWKYWVKNKKRRERRDLRYEWRRIFRGFEAAMESVLIAEAQANLWEKCADIYSDHVFYKHKVTGDISWERPTIATYLPPGYIIPAPPNPLPPGVSIDSTSDSSDDNNNNKRNKPKSSNRKRDSTTTTSGLKNQKSKLVSFDTENLEKDSSGSADSSEDEPEIIRSMHSSDSNAPDVESKSDLVPLSTGTPYIIRIAKAICSNLANVEMSSLAISWSGIKRVEEKNDPYIIFKFDNWVDRTNTIDNAGANAEWNHLDLVFFANDYSLQTKKLEVQVYDQNTLLSDVFIGESMIDLSDLPGLINTDAEHSFTAEIKNESGAITGTVILFVNILIDESAVKEIEKAEERANKIQMNKEKSLQKLSASTTTNSDANNTNSALAVPEKLENSSNELFLSIKKKFTYPGAPRKWPSLAPIQANQIMINENLNSEDTLYFSGKDSVFSYGPDSLRASLPGMLGKPLFQDQETEEGTGLDQDMEKRLNEAKSFMLTDEYASHTLMKTDEQMKSLGLAPVVMKDQQQSNAVELEIAMDTISRRRRQVSKVRKELYLKQFVRRERSFEAILASRKEEVKEEAKNPIPTTLEILHLAGGDTSLMADSNSEAMDIKTMLAYRGLKVKEKMQEKAENDRLVKPKKKKSFWDTSIAPLWRESYIASSSEDENEDDGDDEQEEENKKKKK